MNFIIMFYICHCRFENCDYKYIYNYDIYGIAHVKIEIIKIFIIMIFMAWYM